MKNAIALYRKTMIPMQLGILVICVLVALRGTPLLGTLFLFLVMQAAAIIGSLWGARLQRRVQAARVANHSVLDKHTLR